MVKNFIKIFLRISICLSIILINSFIIKNYFFEVTIVSGASMEPTIHNGEYLFVNKLPKRFNNIKKGDVVSIYVEKEDRYYLKRVIATEGDEVEIKDNYVFINGKLLIESYIKPNVNTIKHNIQDKWIVEKDHLFVLGDNRENSKDGRDLGTLHKDYVLGKTTKVLYPFKNFREIK